MALASNTDLHQPKGWLECHLTVVHRLGRNSIGRWVILLVLALATSANPVSADEMMSSMSGITSEVLVKSSRSWNGTMLPPYAEGTPEISVVKITIPKGASLPMHYHPFATAGVLLEGRLEVRTPSGGNRVFETGAGVIELVNEVHAGSNIGEGPAVILVVYAGIVGEPLTVIGSP